MGRRGTVMERRGQGWDGGDSDGKKGTVMGRRETVMGRRGTVLGRRGSDVKEGIV